jgi:RNA-directed DNA polymerase
MGLELKPSKTRITHTLHPHQGNVGFDFLGFHVRQFPVGKTHSGKLSGPTWESRLLGFKTIIMPSKDAMRRHREALSAVVTAHKMAPQAALIARLNPLIKDWSHYYSTVCSKDALATLDHLLYLKLHRWARFRHPHKSGHWIVRRYWHPERGRWDFRAKGGAGLVKHDSTPIRRHTKVTGDKSPFDGDWVYWARRLGEHPETPKRVAILLKRQQGRCAWCGLYFRDGDLPEVDHIVPLHRGGRDAYTNWQLLHRHCHDSKTARDDSPACQQCSSPSGLPSDPLRHRAQVRYS